MIGRWDLWNTTDHPEPYGLSDTYRLAAEWLEPCSLVEDWGCGRGYMRNFIPAERYRGIDGSGNQADKIVDLLTYRSRVPGIVMRHVLEHNYGWPHVLDNAVASFTERMALVVFTPMQDATREVGFSKELGVPDMGFALADLERRLDGDGRTWTTETLASPSTQYGVETIFRVEVV